MLCPYCNTINPEEAIRCKECHSVFGSDQVTMAGVAGVTATPVSAPSQTKARTPVSASASGAWQALDPDHVLGERYQIVSLLGEGGMGAVYKAHDLELNRTVALKVIRPELAANPDMLERFKQELILSRQITHRNVIRIFDLGLAEGLRFITMEFVEGRDLKRTIGDRRPDLDQAVDILRQICLGLECAHAESVIHRDLKPQNIMIEPQGRVAIMDFGLASAMESTGITRTGVLVGTPDYMSPEQALGRKLDTRSDIFSLGLIFYEMLTGEVPFRTNTVVGTLVARTQRAATPASEVNPKVPAALSDIAARCMAIELPERFQTVREVVAALDGWKSGVTAPAPAPQAMVEPPAAPVPVSRGRRPMWLAGAAVLLVAAAGLWYLNRGPSRPAGPLKPIRVLIADFENQSGDPVFERTLEPMFTVSFEGAPFITCVNRDQARKEGLALEPNSTKLTEKLARLVAVREGYDVVFGGMIERKGEGYLLSTRAVDAVTGALIAGKATEAGAKDLVVTLVSKQASAVRTALGDRTPESAQLSGGETFTAGTLEAAHAYAVAQERQYAGNAEEALREYERAIQLDPKFGRAYAGMAVAHRNAGRRPDAEKYFQLAMQHIERMTDREKLRTLGSYYVTIGEFGKAVEQFRALVDRYPADTAGHANLAVAYLELRNIPKALEEGRRAIEINPKNVGQRGNAALFAMYAGDFEGAIREAGEALKLNPGYLKASVTQALSQACLGQNAKAIETYQRLQSSSARGISLAATGLGDLALYEGRAAEATTILQNGADGDVATGNPSAAAPKLLLLALARLSLGQKEQAVDSLDRAVTATKDENVLFVAGHLYVEAGQASRAEVLASQISQARSRLLRGEILLGRKDAARAIPLMEESVASLDTWFARYGLGRAYLAAGSYAKAVAEFESCIRRRGETTSLVIDDVPTLSILPPAYYYLGRAQESLNDPAAKESYRRFLAIRTQGADALTLDARKRLGQP